jgi:hypothetical protein
MKPSTKYLIGVLGFVMLLILTYATFEIGYQYGWDHPHVFSNSPTPEDVAKKLIENEGNCIELGDCLGVRAYLKEVINSGSWYQCQFKSEQLQAVYSEKVASLLEACNFFRSHDFMSTNKDRTRK